MAIKGKNESYIETGVEESKGLKGDSWEESVTETFEDEGLNTSWMALMCLVFSK